MHTGEIAILDFGSQYTHLIARRVRELGVVSHIYPNDVSSTKLTGAAGIILSGGPKSTLSDDRLAYDPALFALGLPILGLCYGHQLMALHLGGRVAKGMAREYGVASLQIEGTSGKEQGANIFADIPSETTVWMSHGDHVETLPPGSVQIATTSNDSITAMADAKKKMYGFQFHPEVHHTKDGKKMLENFIFSICGATKNWSTGDMLEQIEQEIRQQAGNKKVFLLLSGGVDSTVCFALLEKVLGKNRVYGFHVDHGFMRRDESRQVEAALAKIGITDLHVYNAEDEFLTALAGVTEPEQKRKIIGNLFLDITERVMAKLPGDSNDWLLGQGTIYPDTIESGGTKNADKIKTHHNRVDRIHGMIAAGRIIEPIKELYKDEVRAIGRQLGLPAELLDRHPFPGPGLAIRCLCSDGSDTLPPCRGDGRGVYFKCNNFVSTTNPSSTSPTRGGNVFKLPIKSVGVQGDERSYAHPALIIMNEAVVSKVPPLATARQRDPAQGGIGEGEGGVRWEKLRTLSPQITNQNKAINRVLFLLSGDKNQLLSSTLRPATLTKDRIKKLQTLDAVINNIIRGRADCAHIWQMPIVLVPFGYQHGESLVLRPVESEEAMTVNFAELPPAVLEQIKNEVSSLNLVDFIFYDITNKPPGTIEWE